MRPFYLIMAVIGFALPNYFALRQSLQTGNWLLWRDVGETSALAFRNFVSAAFVGDLMLLLPVALVWMVVEARRLKLKRAWLFAPLALPLFLYIREGRLEPPTAPNSPRPIRL